MFHSEFENANFSGVIAMWKWEEQLTVLWKKTQRHAAFQLLQHSLNGSWTSLANDDHNYWVLTHAKLLLYAYTWRDRVYKKWLFACKQGTETEKLCVYKCVSDLESVQRFSQASIVHFIQKLVCHHFKSIRKKYYLH